MAKDKEQLNEVEFKFTRYANCWEDADVLLEGLNPERGKKFLSIASAGDNSFSLLVSDPEIVVAIDINPIQLHLVELKKEAIRQLSHAEYIAFIGFRPSDQRLKTFDKIKSALPQKTVDFWEERRDKIEKGLIDNGKFEAYFRFFSKKVLPLIHTKKRVRKLLAKKTAEEQETYYRKKWNTWRWRLFFKLFFSKRVMGKYGRDPQFLKEVNLTVSQYIFQMAEQHLKSTHAQQNFILNYTLTGSFQNELPHYAQEKNYSKIKANIDKLITHEGVAENAFQQYGKFHYFNLSNIFEYMDETVFQQVIDSFKGGMEPGAQLAYWNLMVPRRISETDPSEFKYHESLSKQLSEKDKGFFYNQFIVDEYTTS
jgi:S-adenosylmethionine-diacylglycerol 3-amino-3-carboxypropyl transferase